MHAITTDRKKRGSALMAVFVVAALLTGVAVYLFETSADATVTSNVREHVDNTAAVAEYGLEMAISQLANVQSVQQGTGAAPAENGIAQNLVIQGDWVSQQPYEGIDASRQDQRRIGGTVGEGVDETDYRVRVRSVGAAKQLGNMPARWLSAYSPSYLFGTTLLRDFSNLYEITSSARSRQHADSAGKAAITTVTALVELDFDNLPGLLGEAATLNANPLYFRNSGTVDAAGNLLGAGPLSIRSFTALAEPGQVDRFADIQVSGEDHYGTKTVIANTSYTESIDEVASIAGTDSQLFSIITNPWDLGRLTLHYQRGVAPNPHIPRTVYMQNSTYSPGSTEAYKVISQDMVAYSDAEPHDQYFYGGKTSGNGTSMAGTGYQSNSAYYRKQTASGSYITYGFGRSVTLNESEDRIIETTIAQVTPASDYDLKALAIGRPTDFAKLYLNTVPGTGAYPVPNASPAQMASWKNSWTQLHIAHMARNAYKIGQYPRQIPRDNANSGTKRRQAVKFWIKNQDGQFLARDYRYSATGNLQGNSTSTTSTVNNGTYMTPGKPVPGVLAAGNYNQTTHWTGYYAWHNYYGYVNTESAGGGKYHLTYGIPYAGGTANNGQTRNWVMHTRFLTLEELFGYELEKGPDGLPAAFNESGAVVGGVPEFVTDADGNKVPYRPNSNRNGGVTQFDEVYQRDNGATTSGDNWAVASNHEAVYPPVDGIYVVSRNSSNGNMVVDSTGRPVTAVYRVLEDFAFEQNVAKPGEPDDIRKMVNIQMVVETTPEAHTNNTNMYWDMGLAVSVVFDKYVEGAVDYITISDGRNNNWWEGLRQESMSGDTAHYALKIDVPDGILDIEDLQMRLQMTFDEMRLGEDVYEKLYSMVDENGDFADFPRAKFVWSDGALGVKGKLVVPEGAGNVFYYTDDDVERFISRVADQTTRDEWAADENIDPEEEAVRMMYAINADIPGLDLRHIDMLYDPGSGYFKSYLTGDLPSSLMPAGPYVSGREFAMRVFGQTAQTLPAVYTVESGLGGLTPVTRRDLYGPGIEHPSDLADPTNVSMYYLPSEYKADENDAELNDGRLIDNNSEYLDLFNANVNLLQPSGKPISFKIYDEDMDPAKDYRTLLRTPPEWLDYEGIKGEYGLLEARSRGGIGWHRGGPYPDDDDPDQYVIDHYEYVVIGKKGFMPYRTHDGAIALVATRDYDKNDADQVLNKSLDFAAQLKPPSELPTYVISSEGLVNPRDGMPVFTLDGAGILVVNGNLEIRTNFAYHGTLVVLGDIHVRPERRPVYRKDGKGNNLDDTGQYIVYDEAGNFFYFDEEGNKVTVDWPAYAEDFEAKLIVQGQVFLGGALTTFSGEEYDSNGELRHVTGSVDIRASRQAVQETIGILVNGKEPMRIRRIGWSDTGLEDEERFLWDGTERY